MSNPLHEKFLKYLMGVDVPPSSRISHLMSNSSGPYKVGQMIPPAGSPDELTNGGVVERAFDNAQVLKYFEPYKIIHLVLGDPEPDVHIDYIILPILFNPSDESFEVATIEWIKDYRTKRPLDVKKLTDEEMGVYLHELLSMASYSSHVWYRKPGDITRQSSGASYSYECSMGSAGRMSGEETFTFGKNGEIAKIRHNIKGMETKYLTMKIRR